jgi:hypothetical protein
MPLIRIPGIVQLFIVENTQQLGELNRHPHVSRVLSPKGGLLHRLVASRISRDLRFPEGELPAFQRQGNEARRARQEALERQLEQTPVDGAELQGMARFVAGRSDEDALGLAVQQWVGKLFNPHYQASPALRAAARLLESWPRRDPLTALGARASGRLERAKRRLAAAVGGDLHGVHATSLTLPNLIASLERMRDLARDPSLRGRFSPEVIAARSLAGPGAVLRSCTKEVRVSFLQRPLPAHTWILLPLRRLHAGTADDGIAFLTGEWSRCPAHRLIQRLLAQVWIASGAGAPVAALETRGLTCPARRPSGDARIDRPLEDRALPRPSRATSAARKVSRHEPDALQTREEP